MSANPSKAQALAELAQPDTVTREDGADTALATSSRTSAAQRQRAYRQRRRRAAIDAIGHETHASRVTLLALLGSDLAALETGTLSAQMTTATRSSVRRVLAAIVTRYAIEPSAPPPDEMNQ